MKEEVVGPTAPESQALTAVPEAAGSPVSRRGLKTTEGVKLACSLDRHRINTIWPYGREET